MDQDALSRSFENLFAFLSAELFISLYDTGLAIRASAIYPRSSQRARRTSSMKLQDPQEDSIRWAREVAAKRPGYLRILFLGDSLIWSGEEEPFIQIFLEQRLNARSVNKVQYHMPGYTTYQELEFLKLYGLNMEPDFVVLGFVFNNVSYKYMHKPTYPKPAAHLHHLQYRLLSRLFLAEATYTHQLVSAGEILCGKDSWSSCVSV